MSTFFCAEVERVGAFGYLLTCCVLMTFNPLCCGAALFLTYSYHPSLRSAEYSCRRQVSGGRRRAVQLMGCTQA